MSNRRGYGLALVTVAAVFWSLAGLFVRLADVPIWDLIFWRCAFAGGTLFAISLLRPAREAAFGWAGLGASLLAAATMAAYAASLTLTSVANVLIVYATLPFATAGLAWVCLGERSTRRMLVASTVSLAGVALVAGRSLQVADLAGNALAALMTVAFAGLLVMTRRFARLDLMRVNAVAAFLCVLVALPLFSGTVPSAGTLALLAGLGILTTALSFLLFLEGGRHIPSTEAALISLLDVVLGPLWVWLVVSEHPGAGALAGGAIVLAAVVWYLAPTIGWRTDPARRGASPLGRHVGPQGAPDGALRGDVCGEWKPRPTPARDPRSCRP